MYYYPNIAPDILSNTYSDENRKLAVISGATSGIGKAYAFYYASMGYDLLLTGRRRNVILKVAEELRNTYDISVEVVIANLADRSDLSLLMRVLDKRKNIEVLINNAGFGFETKFRMDDVEHQLSMVKVHVNAPLLLIHKVLPVMMKNRKGTIINVSSLAAFIPTADNSMYTSTKLFLKNFSESLYLDVKPYGIKVQCLCPGFIRSDFHRNSIPVVSQKGFNKYLWMEAESAVNYSIEKLDNGKVICIPGFGNRVLRALIWLTPRSLYYLFAGKIEKSDRSIEIPELALH